jgi:hypothetical protein
MRAGLFFWKIIEKNISIKIWQAQSECPCAPGSGHGQEGPIEKDINIKVVLIAHARWTFLKTNLIDLEKDINIKVVLIAHALMTQNIATSRY